MFEVRVVSPFGPAWMTLILRLAGSQFSNSGQKRLYCELVSGGGRLPES